MTRLEEKVFINANNIRKIETNVICIILTKKYYIIKMEI